METPLEEPPPPPPPPTTTAPQPSSSFEDAATVPTSSSVNSHEATRGTGSRPVFDVRYDAEVATYAKPPLVPISGETEPCTACVLKRSRGKQLSEGDRESHGGAWGNNSSLVGVDDNGSSDGMTDHRQHSCSREGSGSGFSLSIAKHGLNRRSSFRNSARWRRTKQRPRGSGSKGSGIIDGDDGNREDLTPVTVFGSVGGSLPAAENEVTPLMSRSPRGSHRGRSGSSSLSRADRREGGRMRDGNQEGRGKSGEPMPKDTITWEAFLTNMSVGGGGDELAGPDSASDSLSPTGSRPTRTDRRTTSRIVGGDTNGDTDGDTNRRTRYLRAMTSNAGSYPWINGIDAPGEGGGDDEEDAETIGEYAETVGTVEEDDRDSESLGGPESLMSLPTTASMPRLIGTLNHVRPAYLDLDVARSLSVPAVGLTVEPVIRQKMQKGVNKFNVNPKEGISYLVDQGLLAESPEGICDFLASEEGLSKRRLGEYFGKDSPKAQEVLSLFLRKLELRDKSLDEALRSMVLKFRLPGEAQQMDRIMEKFAERYHEENPGVFSCAETVWVLSFGLMILNTDMYNRNIKESDKMTQAQFVKNHRGIDQGKDLPEDLLVGMYKRIKTSEIRMYEGDMYESEVITFVAPTMSGWLKKKCNRIGIAKWNRYWFVLNDGVLYYFVAPQFQDQAPRCIIPLEGIGVDPIGITDLSISTKSRQGYVKSVKRSGSGTMEQNHHRAFVLRAKNRTERDAWVDALLMEVPTIEMDVRSRSQSATPVTSSAATPIGTPSSVGQRSSGRFGSRTERRRRESSQDKLSPPILRGWARTQKDNKTWGRSFVALFRGKGLEEEDMLHFFRDASQCDKMVDQGLPTSHLCVPLCDVTRLQLRLEAIDGGGRAIALQAGTGKGARETVIVLEEQKDVGLWIKNIKEWCPSNAHSMSTDGTPMPSSIGETAFPSVNTADSGMDEVDDMVPASGVDDVDDMVPASGLDDMVPASGFRLDGDIGRPRNKREMFVPAASSTVDGESNSTEEHEESGFIEGGLIGASGRTISVETQPDSDTSHQAEIEIEMSMSLTKTKTEPIKGGKGKADVTPPKTPTGTGPDSAGGMGGVCDDSSPMTDVE